MFFTSLARMKREKLYGALDKGRKRVPEEWDFETLIKAFYCEEVEFIKAYNKFTYGKSSLTVLIGNNCYDPSVADIKDVMYEIADLSNILDFIFDKMLTEIEMIMKAHQKMERDAKDKMFDEMNESRVKLGLKPMKRFESWDVKKID